MSRQEKIGLLMIMIAMWAQLIDIVIAGEIPPTNWLRVASGICGGLMFYFGEEAK